MIPSSDSHVLKLPEVGSLLTELLTVYTFTSYRLPASRDVRVASVSVLGTVTAFPATLSSAEYSIRKEAYSPVGWLHCRSMEFDVALGLCRLVTLSGTRQSYN